MTTGQKHPDRDLRVVFMGTPEFAVASLEALLDSGFEVAAVVTSPDKPAGRGRLVSKPAVKVFSEKHGLSVLQPENLKDQSFIERLRELKADVFVVVAFRMLPEAVWRIPAKGTINLHGALLPQYRGAAPVNHAIINGETVTGVTTFLIDDKIDTGNILLREEVPILQDENAGDLHDKLMALGGPLIIRTLEGIASGTLKPRSQDEFIRPGEILRNAPKIFPENCIIDWNNPPAVIHNLIRGLSPYPCARSVFDNRSVTVSYKICKSQPEEIEHAFKPGQVISDGRSYLKVACTGGYISILELQPESKRKMAAAEFLRGFRISGFTAGIS